MHGIEYKLLLVGDAGVGKTTFIKRHRTGDFEARYLATVGTDIKSLTFSTNYGKIKFNIHDTAGQEKFGPNRLNSYNDSQCSILMFDCTSMMSYRNIPQWHNDVVQVCGQIPMVLCGNKCDIANRRVNPEDISFHHENNMRYYDISARSNYNFEKPFLHLARTLTGHQDLVFVSA